jgi:hypothetical protein
MPETKVPAIKNIPAKLDSETKLVLESIKEALEVRLGRRGDELDRAITLRELIDSGLATQLAQSPYNPNTGATGFGPIGERPARCYCTASSYGAYCQRVVYRRSSILESKY